MIQEDQFCTAGPLSFLTMTGLLTVSYLRALREAFSVHKFPTSLLKTTRESTSHCHNTAPLSLGQVQGNPCIPSGCYAYSSDRALSEQARTYLLYRLGRPPTGVLRSARRAAVVRQRCGTVRNCDRRVKQAVRQKCGSRATPCAIVLAPCSGVQRAHFARLSHATVRVNWCEQRVSWCNQRANWCRTRVHSFVL